eukprot:symbB.v1.2.012895.t1/scaffold899.1/size154094/1
MRKVCITGCPESQEAAKTSLWNFLERAKEHKKKKEQQGNQVVDYIEVREGYGVRADLDDNVNEPLRKLELKGTGAATVKGVEDRPVAAVWESLPIFRW